MARKITQEAVNAFLNNQNYSKDNTMVIVHDHNQVELALHGNCIAKKDNGKISITTAGWFTNTTKERLNAIPGVRISQIRGVWYLSGKEWDGKPIDIN